MNVRNDLLKRIAKGPASYMILAADIPYRDRQPYFAELFAMVAEGLVDRELGKDDEHPPYYSLTPKGRKLL